MSFYFYFYFYSLFSLYRSGEPRSAVCTDELMAARVKPGEVQGSGVRVQLDSCRDCVSSQFF